jgi:hypothetical protein
MPSYRMIETPGQQLIPICEFRLVDSNQQNAGYKKETTQQQYIPFFSCLVWRFLRRFDPKRIGAQGVRQWRVLSKNILKDTGLTHIRVAIRYFIPGSSGGPSAFTKSGFSQVSGSGKFQIPGME